MSLTLDASTFTEEQRRAIDALRKFEQQAKRVSQGAKDSLGASIVSFFRMVEHPASSLHRMFENFAIYSNKPRRALKDVADEARRTGQEVEQSAGRGASALMAFGVAGVAAFAAYEALSKTMGAVNRMAGGVFNTGIGAYIGGMGIQQFSAIAKALNVTGNVPEGQTEDFLSNLGQMRARYLREPGALSAMNNAFTMAGINASMLWEPSSPTYQTDLLLSIHDQLAAMSPERRQMAISNLNDIIPGNILNALAQPSTPDEFRRQLGHAPSAEQQAKIADLIKAENELAQAMGSLERDILVYLVPPLTRLAQMLDALIGGTPGSSVLGSGINPETGQSGMMGWVKDNLPAGVYNWLSKFPALAPKKTGAGDSGGTPSGAARTGRGSVYGWPGDPDSGVQANGEMVGAGPGIALYDRSTLGQWFDVTGPDGKTYRTQQTDVGPNPRTGRMVDINATLASQMGYNKGNFPTDAQFTVTPVSGLNTRGSDPVGAYGVPGATMNFGAAGGVGAAGTNLVQLRDKQGHTYTVNAAAADAFQGFLEELEAHGYPVHSLGGYNMRDKTGGGGLSEHAYGLAIDVNPDTNPYGGHQTDMPAGIHALAAKYGLVWGGDWSGSGGDPMHFQWGGTKPWKSIQAANAGVTNNSGGNTTLNGTSITVNAPTREGSDIALAVGGALGHAARAANANANGIQ